MKAVAVTLVLLGLVAGCQRQSWSPSASPGSYTTKSTCERAGYTWDSAAGVCR